MIPHPFVSDTWSEYVACWSRSEKGVRRPAASASATGQSVQGSIPSAECPLPRREADPLPQWILTPEAGHELSGPAENDCRVRSETAMKDQPRQGRRLAEKLLDPVQDPIEDRPRLSLRRRRAKVIGGDHRVVEELARDA